MTMGKYRKRNNIFYELVSKGCDTLSHKLMIYCSTQNKNIQLSVSPPLSILNDVCENVVEERRKLNY